MKPDVIRSKPRRVSQSWHKARKIRTCHSCGCYVWPGEDYLQSVWRSRGGAFDRIAQHDVCVDAWGGLESALGVDPDEMPWEGYLCLPEAIKQLEGTSVGALLRQKLEAHFEVRKVTRTVGASQQDDDLFGAIIGVDYIFPAWETDLHWIYVEDMDAKGNPGMFKIGIARKDYSDTEPSWWQKQVIKDIVAGPDRVAVEVFPRSCEIVDDYHLWHLWVMPHKEVLPFKLVSPRGGVPDRNPWNGKSPRGSKETK